MESPSHFWIPSIAPSGLMVYDGDRFPGWRGSTFVGGMAGQQLARVTLGGPLRSSEETLLYGLGRVRDVRQSPDGYIYVAIEDRGGEPTAVYRLEPAGAR
jgi:glucose/arabinose dehydrogenase